MSTRRAKDPSVFHQSRFASSVEIETGLRANLVAKRLSVVKDATHRELIWFLQYCSHQESGLEAVAQALLEKYQRLIGTSVMIEIGKKHGDFYTTDEIQKVRLGLPTSFRGRLKLRGEIDRDVCHTKFRCDRELAEATRFEGDVGEPFNSEDIRQLKKASKEASQSFTASQAAADKLPQTYSVMDLVNICNDAAICTELRDSNSLVRELYELCLDPGYDLQAGPWYFCQLTQALLEYQQDWIKAAGAGVVTTELGAKVWEALDYTKYSGSLSLVEGNARMGKTFSARKWADLHPGHARFVEVPPGNDDISFYRALARGLGLGNFLNYKTIEIRERVESVLLNSDLMLVLDEAQRLWPQRNLRYGFPNRINWVMTMANHGVPICCVCTPQFIEAQKVAEKFGWNSAQLTGRIHHYQQLPASLSHDDLMAVAKALLPESDAATLKAVAICAKSSARYLSAIEAVAKRAHFLANRAGRIEAMSNDVRKAMQESFIPSDTKMKLALEAGKNARTSRIKPEPIQAMPQMRGLSSSGTSRDVIFPNRNNEPVALAVDNTGEH